MPEPELTLLKKDSPLDEGSSIPAQNLDDESLELLSKKLNIPVDSLRSKKIQVSPDFVQKLKEGKVEFVRKLSDPVDAPAISKAGSPPLPQNPPSARATLEQRYTDTLTRENANTRSSMLPKTVKNIPLSPAHISTDDFLSKKLAISEYMEHSEKLNKRVLSERPAGAPNILEECKTPIKLFVSQHQSPGDILMLSRAVDDLHRSYPGMFITCMRTPAIELWENNPYHTKIEDSDPDAMWISTGYKLVNTSNRGSHHFCHGFRKDFEAKLGLPIDQTSPHGAIYLSDKEKSWFSQVREITGKDLPFWIIDAGRKSDYTAKLWEVARFQEVIDKTPHIMWVQVGSNNPDHFHPDLTGDNLIDLRGKTTHRQFVRLMYHAAGVLTPVSYPMHLAAAVEMHPRYKRSTRPCIVIAGGREPAMWEAYSHHQFLHTCGALPCCSHGGCWKSRVEPIGDGDEKDYDEPNRTRLCEMPIISKSGQVIPKCMDLISSEEVVGKVNMYMDSYDFSSEDTSNWSRLPFDKPKEVKEKIKWAIDNRAEFTKKAAEKKAAKRPPVLKDTAPEPKRKTAKKGKSK